MNFSVKRFLLINCVWFLLPFSSIAQSPSIARQWNNLILEAIRNDYARPTVHARNLYHHSIIAYDGWAAYDPSRTRYFLGNTFHGYVCAYDSISLPANIEAARHKTISYASYRFIKNRYANSPDYASTLYLINNLMQQFGYDTSVTSVDYVNGGPAELGNYLAQQIQMYGLTDGSNEQNGFSNQFYDQLNPPLQVAESGNPNIQDPNHWQPLALDVLIDQSGNVITTTQPHLSPEWGEVHPFSMAPNMSNQLTRNGDTYTVYFDSMQPALLQVGDSSSWDSFYKWNHSLVSIWQSHLDPSDGVMWDISPGAIGNNSWYPSDSSEYPLFYNLIDGGDPGTGYALNPVTGQPYTPQIVHRADYARVLAEFWADGLDSETPPGHWFEIYHYVSDQPTFERKWKGVGPVLDALEYDVKAQLTLGGTVHDAAICAWSLKGYYDYLRPVSAIRYMADQGQSSDVNEVNYSPNGIPLLPGYIEVVQLGDTMAGQWNEHLGKIKLFTWKGHDYITNTQTEIAGVGWILAENWWPYQRPTFVTPPFAGFVSGHSTFSRAAAHTMEFITGSPYFPGGMGEFLAPMNDYLQFEAGPSDTIRLQWASYQDASDQCSLSRIWGGIHPPIDDIPGRKIGDIIGPMASLFADSIFSIEHPSLIAVDGSDTLINRADIGSQFTIDFTFNVGMDTSIAPSFTLVTPLLTTATAVNQIVWIDSFQLQITLDVLPSSIELLTTEVRLLNLESGGGTQLSQYTFLDLFIVDTRRPSTSSIVSSHSVIADAQTTQNVSVTVEFDEACSMLAPPIFTFSGTNYLNPTMTPNATLSGWINDTSYIAVFNPIDFNEEVDTISLLITGVVDTHENTIDDSTGIAPFKIDTENPTFISVTPDDLLISQADLLAPTLNVDFVFSEAMKTTILPSAQFENQGTLFTSLVQNVPQTIWTDTNSLAIQFLIYPDVNNLTWLDLNLSSIFDANGNAITTATAPNVIQSDMRSPEVNSHFGNTPVINDSVVGSAIYYVDVTFNEAMDTTVVPMIQHTASQTITNSIQYNVPLSYYIDSFTYRAFYQVMDQNVEVAPVNLVVQFAKDFAGNQLVNYTASNFTSIDTKNPNIVNIYANDYTLDQWGQSFEVLAIYDEPMRTDVFPMMAFSPVMSFNFPKQDSIWSNGMNHTMRYELQGGPNQTTFYAISVNGAVDLAGNAQNTLNIADFLQISPVLGLEDLTVENAYVFPSILSPGTQLHLVGTEQTNVTENFICINALGQNVGKIQFEQHQNAYISAPISLSPGMYYLTNGFYRFKIIVK